MKKIIIKGVNQFVIPVLGNNFFKAIVIYEKKQKSYVAKVYVDFEQRFIIIPKQPKGYKVLIGLEQTLFNHYFPQKK